MDPTSSCQILASVQISFHILRDNMARSNSGPVACPIGHIIPKLRMDAPPERSLRSNRVTLYPRKAKARAVARPTMPAPIIIARLFEALIPLVCLTDLFVRFYRDGRFAESKATTLLLLYRR